MDARIDVRRYQFLAVLVFVISSCAPGTVLDRDPVEVESFPAAGWHRADVRAAQENTEAAVLAAFRSSVPNIEVDIIDYVDADGNRVGLLAHETTMERTTGYRGRFRNNQRVDTLRNHVDPSLPPEPFLKATDFFRLVSSVADTLPVLISLDLKPGGGRAFGRWIAEQVIEHGLERNSFASSFDRKVMLGFREGCPDCLAGGIVFQDHWGLGRLSPKRTSLDLTRLSRMTFFVGFWGKRLFDHDFVLIQDDVLFEHPELIDYWRNERGARFIGVFVYNKDRPYTDEEWAILEQADWLELDPPQMGQYKERALAAREGD